MKKQIWEANPENRTRFFPLGSATFQKWLKLDLSRTNPELTEEIIFDRQALEAYIFGKIREAGAWGAYGGYGEDRGIYRKSEVFGTEETRRSIHLGVDLWAEAGSEVHAVMSGTVHGFANNASPGDYGPTIILKHGEGDHAIYSLYGHLSEKSLVGLRAGQTIAGNQVIGTLGSPKENVDWPPHLHFQLIRNIGNHFGDYPGVCLPTDARRYLKNCPDPLEYLGWTAGEIEEKTTSGG